MVLRAVAACLTLALAGVAAGCGASSSKPVAAPTSITTAPSRSGSGFRSRQLPAAFLACLKQQGVTFPSGGFRRPQGGTGGASGTTTTPSFPRPTTAERQKRQAAFAACRKFAPQGFGQGFGRGPAGAGGGRFAQYVSCMKKHGVTIRPGGGGGGGGGGVNLASPKFQAAAKQCRSLLPTFGGGAPSTGTTG
jgi:hypothetical protein